MRVKLRHFSSKFQYVIGDGFVRQTTTFFRPVSPPFEISLHPFCTQKMDEGTKRWGVDAERQIDGGGTT
jgi:hypothetical protein